MAGGSKTCTRCDQEKPEAEFYTDKRRQQKVRRCRTCISKAQLSRRYGLSHEDYDALCAEQENRCAICGTHACTTGRLLAVDHNHETGKVRGLLCLPCNVSLGNMKDDPALLRNAIAYLERS